MMKMWDIVLRCNQGGQGLTSFAGTMKVLTFFDTPETIIVIIASKYGEIQKHARPSLYVCCLVSHSDMNVLLK